MMENNGSYYYWGMHMGWWFFILVVVIAVIGWVGWSRKKKIIHIIPSIKSCSRTGSNETTQHD